MKDRLVSALAFKSIHYALQRQGHELDADMLLSKLGLTHLGMASTEKKIPVEQYYWAWQFAIEKSDDPLLGLHAGANMHPSLLGVLGYALMNCSTIADAWELGFKANPFGNTTIKHEVVQSGDSIAFQVLTRGDVDMVRPWVEMNSSGLLTIFHHLTNFQFKGAYTYSEVNFRHEPAATIEEYEKVFGCPVHFGQEVDSFVFNSAVATQPVALANGNDLKLFLEQLGLSDKVKLEKKIKNYVKEKMPKGMPDQEEAAAYLGISASTLKRHLKGEGTSYGAICTRLRQDTAKEMLAQPGVKASDIALLLGYASSAPFFRAFKTWEGVTPIEYRRALSFNRPLAA